jgi:preprotein translocase SecF subunit
MVLGSFALLFTKGLNFGIDFAGGILIEARAPGQPDLADIRARLSRLELGEVALQAFGDQNDVLIRLPQQAGANAEAAQQAAIAKVRAELGDGWDYRRTETVGPKVGAELVKNAILAAALAMGGIFLYVWIRYDWQFGLNALLAMFHDVITTLGLFSLLGLQFDLVTVAAILTIAGYSVNDTVVIFDRIRFEMRRFKTMPMSDLINRAINETLSRTTVTSGLTLISVVALALFGGEVLRGFAVALIWGIVIGTYSTICVASPILLYANLRQSKIRGEDKTAKPGKSAESA